MKTNLSYDHVTKVMHLDVMPLDDSLTDCREDFIQVNITSGIYLFVLGGVMVAKLCVFQLVTL